MPTFVSTSMGSFRSMIPVKHRRPGTACWAVSGNRKTPRDNLGLAV